MSSDNVANCGVDSKGRTALYCGEVLLEVAGFAGEFAEFGWFISSCGQNEKHF